MKYPTHESQTFNQVTHYCTDCKQHGLENFLKEDLAAAKVLPRLKMETILVEWRDWIYNVPGLAMSQIR